MVRLNHWGYCHNYQPFNFYSFNFQITPKINDNSSVETQIDISITIITIMTMMPVRQFGSTIIRADMRHIHPAALSWNHWTCHAFVHRGHDTPACSTSHTSSQKYSLDTRHNPIVRKPFSHSIRIYHNSSWEPQRSFSNSSEEKYAILRNKNDGELAARHFHGLNSNRRTDPEIYDGKVRHLSFTPQGILDASPKSLQPYLRLIRFDKPIGMVHIHVVLSGMIDWDKTKLKSIVKR